MKPLNLTSICVVLISMLVSASASNACSCIQPPAPKQAMKNAGAVFSGKIIEIKQAKFQKQVTFKVLKIWKGEIGKKVTVTTATSGAACGYHFSQKGDGTYLVYCYKSKNAKQLSTGLCTRTRALANAAKDVKELGDGRLPK